MFIPKVKDFLLNSNFSLLSGEKLVEDLLLKWFNTLTELLANDFFFKMLGLCTFSLLISLMSNDSIEVLLDSLSLDI